MKAFVFTDVQSGLQLRDQPRPVPQKGQVLIEVKAAGLCHSDCFILNDDRYGMITKRPIVLGHEVAGVIVELGSEVVGYEVGDRVVAGLRSHPVNEQRSDRSIGLGYDGGYAEYTTVWVDSLMTIPSGVSFAQAAVATDSIATAYHAVITEGQVGQGSTVAIVGLGGLGMAAVQVAVLQGARVYGVDIDENKWALGKNSGAAKCAKSLKEFTDIAFDTVLDFAGAGVTTAGAIKAVKPNGRVVAVGLAARNANINTHALITRNIRLQGSIGASLDELKTVLQLLADGKIHPVLEEIPFASIPLGLKRLDEGKVSGRLFADPSRARVKL